MRTSHWVFLAIVAGLAAGVFLSSSRRDDPALPAAPPADGDSYYLAHFQPTGIVVDRMVPRLVTPLPAENTKNCPQDLKVVRHEIGAWVAAIGSATFTETAPRVGPELDRAWSRIASAVARDGHPPLRVAVKHYPRPTLPGRCVTIDITFYDVVDSFIDETFPGGRPRPIEGVLFLFRRTYRLDGGEPRLVEMQVEAHRDVVIEIPRLSAQQLIGARAAPFHLDETSTAHFKRYGGGTRHGLLWIDGGTPWSCAYRIEGHAIETEAATGRSIERMRAFLLRS